MMKDELRLYALALMATNTTLSVIACACIARSFEEATGIGILRAHNEFPVEDGWSNHQVSTVEIIKPLIDKVR